MHKNGFSIAEFLMAMAITLVIVVAVTPVIFKKNIETANFGKRSGTFVCSCAGGSSPKTCTFTVDDAGSREFYTVQLLGGGGGGGAGTDKRGGGAGEAKVVYYPSMKKGQYTITIGAGGGAGNPGGKTKISYKSTGADLEQANGGITTNEAFAINDESKGEASTYSENGCGKGGDAGGSGTAGEVIIRW